MDAEDNEINPHLSNRPFEDHMTDGQVMVEIQANSSKPAKVDLLTAFKQYTSYSTTRGLGASGKITRTAINGHPAIAVEHAGGKGPDGPGYFIERDSTHAFYILVYGAAETDTVKRIISGLTFTQ